MQLIEPRGHNTNIERLWKAAAAGHLPHALFFEGPAGVGKGLSALWFAAGLLCAEGPGRPCGACGPCRRVTSGGEQSNHPDLFLLDPDALGEETVKVARIADREGSKGVPSVGAFLEKCAVESALRPVVLLDAHRMNTSAQNALLKTLEEPRPGTVLILVTHRVDALLETILSRVVRVRFKSLDASDCARILQAEGLEPDEATRLARWAEGSPGEALRLARINAEGMSEILAKGFVGEASPFALARALWELDGSFPGGTPTAQSRMRARAILGLYTRILRDRLRCAAGVPAAALAFSAFVDGVLSEEHDRLRLEAAFEARADVERNLAPEAALERALFCLVQPALSYGGR